MENFKRLLRVEGHWVPRLLLLGAAVASLDLAIVALSKEHKGLFHRAIDRASNYYAGL